METEKEFKEIFGKLSHDQLLDIAYNLKKEVVALQEKNSSLKRAMYGRRRENVHIKVDPVSRTLKKHTNKANRGWYVQ